MINRNEDGAGFTWAHANPPSIKKFKNYKETKKKKSCVAMECVVWLFVCFSPPASARPSKKDEIQDK